MVTANKEFAIISIVDPVSWPLYRTMLFSYYKNSRAFIDSVDIIILIPPEVSKEDQESLFAQIQKEIYYIKNKITVFQISRDAKFQQLINNNKQSFYSPAYYKFCIFKYNWEYSGLIFLDADLLNLKDVSFDYFDYLTYCNKFCKILACKDIGEQNLRQFNTGLLFVPIRNLLLEEYYSQLIDDALKHQNPHADQESFNRVFSNSWQSIPHWHNILKIAYPYSGSWLFRAKTIHYVGRKPNTTTPRFNSPGDTPANHFFLERLWRVWDERREKHLHLQEVQKD